MGSRVQGNGEIMEWYGYTWILDRRQGSGRDTDCQLKIRVMRSLSSFISVAPKPF